MQEPLIPRNEEERLAALTALEVLDTRPEERFDRITRLAADLFNVPICLVSLIDVNRQWFKSCVGLDVAETDRNISFCGHAIHSDQVLCIPDTHHDPRFADNPLVTGPPYIRFYAGAPLSLDGKHNLGTLCIIDQSPREFPERSREQLKALAEWVVRELGMVQLARETRRADRNEAKLNSILQSVFEGIFTLDGDSRLTSVNKSVARMLGTRPDELLGLTFAAILPSVQTWDRLKEERVLETEILRLDGSLLPVQLALQAVNIDEHTAWVGSCQDLTDRRAAESVRRDFISVVSHELRTPVTAMRGAVVLLEKLAQGRLDEHAANLLVIARRNADRLLALVNDILDIEKLAAGQMTLVMLPAPLQELVRSATDINQTLAANRQISLSLEMPDEEILVEVDKDRFQQVLTNLISNAVKFSPEGKTVQVCVTAADNQRVVVSVRDQGPGIPGEFQERIFERFYQVPSLSQQVKGTGLGLSIARELAEKMECELTVESVAGEGATFQLSVPLLRTGH